MAIETPSRIHTMDSLRGIASLQVLIHHGFCMTMAFYAAYTGIGTFSDSAFVNAMTFSPLHFIWAGHEAVIFFFVMSGFVLSIPYFNDKEGTYSAFFIKRIFRIYFPYLIALILGFILNSIFVSHSRIAPLSGWFNQIYNKPLTKYEVFNFVFLLKGIYHNVVTSLWSLPVEIKLSLLLPLILKPLKKVNRFYSLALPFLNMAFYHLGKRVGLETVWADFSLFYYFSFFLFGTVLCEFHLKIIARFKKLKKAWVFLLLLISIILYVFKWNIQWLPNDWYVIMKSVPSDYVTALSSLILLGLGMSSFFHSTLSNKYLAELGKVSFSMYLVHPLIIAIVGFELGNLLPAYLLVFIAIVFSIAFAFPFHYFIESPLQRIGRDLGNKFN